MIQLQKIEPFAQGGNRLCFVHPEDASLCIKVRRPDFTLEDRRRKKGFPKNLRKLSSFDDNLEEFNVMRSIERYYGQEAFVHISRCYGFVDTDMGRGLVSELIRNSNGCIAETLKKEIWDAGITCELDTAIKEFSAFWISNTLPSRDLLLHNIVVQCLHDNVLRLVVVDGLGSAGLIPLRFFPRKIQKGKVLKKIHNMNDRIKLLLSQRGQDTFPGYHGKLLHNDNVDLDND